MKNIKLILVYICVFLLTFSLTSCKSQPSNSSSLEIEGFKKQLYHNVIYSYPEQWFTEEKKGSMYHYPPDGGMLFVNPASWGLEDMSVEENAYKGIDYTIRLMGKNFEKFSLKHYEEQEIFIYTGVYIEFDMEVNEEKVFCKGWIFAMPKEREVVQFIFAYPNIENNELKQYTEEIVESIH